MATEFTALTRLPEDALVHVFSHLPATTHAALCCVSREWYRFSAYPDVFAELLSRRVRYWVEWMQDQPKQHQTLAALIAAHPILASADANEHLEQVALSSQTHPTASGIARLRIDQASSGPSAARVTIQTAQLLNLVEILTSGFRSGIRRTHESHTQSLTGELLQPLQSFAIQSLDLSGFGFVDTSVVRALAHLPSLSSLRFARCKLLTDAAVCVLFAGENIHHLTLLDLSGNSQLTGKGWLDGSAREEESSLAAPFPSSLTALHLSDCTRLSPSALGVTFFTEVLSRVRVLDLTSTNAKMLLAVIKSLPHIACVEQLLLASCGWALANPVELRLLRDGRFSANPLATAEGLLMAGDDIDTARPSASDDSSSGCTLTSLHTIDLADNQALPDEALAYLLQQTTSALTSLTLSHCVWLSPDALAAAILHVGDSLVHLDLGVVQVDDTMFQTLSDAERSAPLLPRLLRLNLVASTASYEELSRFLAMAAPLLESLQLTYLRPAQPDDDDNGEAEIALRERQMDAVIRASDRAAIERHALDHGLELPTEPEPAQAQHPSSGPVSFGPLFALAIASKQHLTHLDLTCNAGLTDSDIDVWTEETTKQVHASRLAYLNLSGCTHVTSVALARLVTAISTTTDRSSLLQLVANDCPHVTPEELELFWLEHGSRPSVVVEAESCHL